MNLFFRQFLTILFILSIITYIPLKAQFSVQKENGGYLVMENGKRVAFYQLKPTGPTPELLRNNFWHPVYLPEGTVITENAPEDHPHQRGIFWAWHQILVNGKSIGDGWDLTDYYTRVNDFSYRITKNDNAEVQTDVTWYSPHYNSAEKPYLEEKTTVVFHPQKMNFRVIDFSIKLTSLVDSLKLGGSNDVKGYGGFSTRIKLPEDVTFVSSGGKVEPQNEAVEAGMYMNISGSYAENGSSPGGILIVSDSDNQTSPQSWILRNKDSMQNPVFPGRDPVSLDKNKALVLKYKLILYKGTLNFNEVIASSKDMN